MAIDNTNNEWDEDAINALYRSWQRSRDGIDYRHYRTILHAAREMAQRSVDEKAETARRMDVIRVAAREQVLDQRLSSVEQEQESGRAAARPGGLEKKVNALKTSVFRGIADFIDSLSPRQWVPVAVTAALAVAVVPFVLDTDTGSGLHGNLTAQTEMLSSQGATVAAELDRLGDFQLGFASGSGEYARAFGAGVVFSNLVGLGRENVQARRQRSLAELETLTGQSIDAGESISSVELGNRLQDFYSRDGYWSVFVFGQWVETGYLLTRLALTGTDKAASTETLITLLEDKSQMVDLLSQSGHYDSRLGRDLDLLEMAVGDGALDNDELQRVGNVLLKLRTVESRR